MGICLYMNLDNDKKCPFWFTKTDSKMFVWYIIEVENGAGAVPNIIGKLVEHFGIDIQPLLKIAGQDLSLEEFGNNEEIYNKYQASNQGAWQNPQELISCLRNFIGKIDNEPNVFSHVFSHIKVKDDFDYFNQGFFRQDLLDIMQMADWAAENGATKIRLIAA